MRRDPAQPWSLLATALTAVGCIGLLGGIVLAESWATVIGAVLLCAAAAANVLGIIRTRHTARPDDPPFV